MKKSIIFFLFLIFLLPLISAIQIKDGIVLGVQGSPTKITFSFDATAETIRIESGYIRLTNIDYTYAGNPYHCDVLTHSQPFTLDSSEFDCTNLGGTPGSGAGEGTEGNQTLNITNIIYEPVSNIINEIEEGVRKENLLIKTIIWIISIIFLLIIAFIMDI